MRLETGSSTIRSWLTTFNGGIELDLTMRTPERLVTDDLAWLAVADMTKVRAVMHSTREKFVAVDDA